MNKFYLVNVVWYDGSDAYVSKFILEADGQEITKDASERLEKYLRGNGEILKVDILYSVTLDYIMGYKVAEKEPELTAAYDRFNSMYFK